MASPKVRFRPRPIRRIAAWLCAAAFAWFGSLDATAVALDVDAQRTLVNKGVIGIIGDGARGSDFELIADLAIALDEGYDLRVLPMAGSGSVRAIEDLLLLRGVDVAIVQADVLDYYKKADLFPSIGEKIRYLARLYGKEMHILASRDIGSIEDLEGKRVNFGPPSSGSFLTASLVFDTLGINVEAGADDYLIALDKLNQGEVDAWVRVDAKPTLQIESQSSSDGLHFLSIPASAVTGSYIASSLTSEDYPTLIDEGETVETLAVPSIMAVYNWPPESRKNTQIRYFGNALVSNLDKLQRRPFHKKWRDVDPNAGVAGWERF